LEFCYESALLARYGDVRVDTVADPTIEDPRDIVIKITSTAICGSFELTRYDVGGKVTDRDVEVAKKISSVYRARS
jgi:threonine dehydrogenase-like Zn-dependent dehydrogenase